MKKILIAFDGTFFSEGAFEFARRICEHGKTLLTGVFLPQVDYSTLWSYADGTAGSSFVPVIKDSDGKLIQANIARFQKLCKKYDIDFEVHKDFSDFTIPAFKKETRFSDLAILGSERLFLNMGIGKPNEYLRDALHAAECPVVVVPEKFDYPKSIILTYDGTESSVYAIKQFAYLFPELCENKTVLVKAGTDNNNLPSEQNIRELVECHFPNIEFLELNIDPKRYFSTWVSEINKPIVVSGAFSRSTFSELFRKSFVSGVIKDHSLPVFIAHR